MLTRRSRPQVNVSIHSAQRWCDLHCLPLKREKPSLLPMAYGLENYDCAEWILTSVRMTNRADSVCDIAEVAQPL
jgi:hypothetical protein